jgi:uncharacterized ferritin-like protein (DUF455 family)
MMQAEMPTNRLAEGLGAAIRLAFDTAVPEDKAQKAQKLFASLPDYGTFCGTILPVRLADRPGRPDRPELKPPRLVPRRRISKHPKGRIALLHAIAHIELNAIDLALDMAIRYADQNMPFDFVHDWLSVAADEGRHFMLLSDRLKALDSHYGALDAHDGLWEAALKTKDDLLARLAIAPLVLEARGLDITPQLITKMEQAEDSPSAQIFHIIMTDEVRHVAVGKKWFDYVCGCERRDPISTWQMLVTRYFNGALKPPFNIDARNAARFSAAFYGPLAAAQAKSEMLV